MKPIPVSAALDVAKKYDYDQVIIIARKVDSSPEAGDGGEHVTTAGIDELHCGVAARLGDFFKFDVMGWDRSQTEVHEDKRKDE